MYLVLTRKATIEGYTAGWIAMRMLKHDCEWVQIGDGDPVPPMKDKDVLMFGVSYSREKILKLQDIKNKENRPNTIFVFDNDFDVKAQIAGLKNVKVNLKQTAARMAWEHLRADFRVKFGPNKKSEFHFLTAPWIVDYSANSKLWKWSGVSQFYVALAINEAFKQSLESWDELATRDLSGIESVGKDLAKKKAAEIPAAALTPPVEEEPKKAVVERSAPVSDKVFDDIKTEPKKEELESLDRETAPVPSRIENKQRSAKAQTGKRKGVSGKAGR